MQDKRRYRTWTEDDTATTRRMSRAGYSTRSIAGHLDRDHAQVVWKMREHEILPGTNPAHLIALARVNMARRYAFAA